MDTKEKLLKSNVKCDSFWLTMEIQNLIAIFKKTVCFTALVKTQAFFFLQISIL